MSLASTRAGQFGVVASQGRGSRTAIRQRPQHRQLVDVEALPREQREAIEADDFVIYGKASVEKYDNDAPSQLLTMKALEDAKHQLFESGQISRRHKDVKVGEILPSYKLEEPTTVVVGDEVHEYPAGHVLETKAEDGAMWLVANLNNNTEIARETRYKSLTGDLDGFSVTIFAKETTPTQKGERVDALDWHSVTIGEDDKIKNPGSRFGVAEFKLFEDGEQVVDDLIADVTSALDSKLDTRTQPKTMTDNNDFWNAIYEKAGEEIGLSEDELEKIRDSDDAHEDLGGADNESESGGDSPNKSGPGEKITEEGLESKEGGATQEALMIIENEYGPEARAAVEEQLNMQSSPAAPEPEMDAPPAEDETLKMDEATEETVKALIDERIEALEEKMATTDDLAAVREDTKAAVAETIPEAMEGLAGKMATGNTPSAAGGSTHDQTDYMADIEARFSPGAKAGGEGE